MGIDFCCIEVTGGGYYLDVLLLMIDWRREGKSRVFLLKGLRGRKNLDSLERVGTPGSTTVGS